MVLDPIAQAWVDSAAGEVPADEWRERWEAWGDEGFREYRRQMRALEPAEAPLPWRVVIGLLAVECAMAEYATYVERRWPGWRTSAALTPVYFAAAWPIVEFRRHAGRDAARRLGVTRVGEGPPEPPRAPVMIVALGASVSLSAMRRRGVRWPRGSGLATTVAATVVREWEIRRRWRGWTSGRR